MDVSKQLSDDTSCTGVSMYLSFDSNSTMSNAAYRTLEGICDLSAMGISTTGNLDASTESNLNSTLEGMGEVQDVKSMEQVPFGPHPPRPLKVLNENILQEYKAISSTPTREQLLQNTKVSGNSKAVCMHLGVAFVAASDTFFQEENKENCITESEISNLSSSSVIEKKHLTLVNTEKEASKELKQSAKVEEMETDEAQEVGVEENTKIVQSCTDPAEQKKNYMNKNYRKSVCEPNLSTNRPSRIVTNIKNRASLIPSARPSEPQDVSDIPKLLNKMLKISTVLQKDEFKDSCPNKATGKLNKQQIPTAAKKKFNSLLPPMTGSRAASSLMPQAEKRPFSFTHRMSIVVKTTLNSPARKMARKSFLSSGPISGIKHRKSVFPNSRYSIASATSSTAISTVAQTNGKHIVQPSSRVNQKSQINRQSLLPTIATSPKSKLLPTVLEHSAKNLQATIQLKPVLGKKSDSIYTCSYCSRQFRIKSLLDAHKRSHEEDFPTSTAVAKKPSTHPTAAAAVLHSSSANDSTQCKYCDKKFAIVRALHIHLMQNCLKIPPGEKRKLQFTEMNHVEKAQLPLLFSTPYSILTTASKKLIKTNTNLSSTSINSTELLVENKDKVTTIESDHTQMAPPSQLKLRKKSAHSGVYRTPSKNVPCHLCKQSFKNILDYTHHTMAAHSSAREAQIQIPDSTN